MEAQPPLHTNYPERSPVAHLNGVQGVAGSNPAVPIFEKITKQSHSLGDLLRLCAFRRWGEADVAGRPSVRARYWRETQAARRVTLLDLEKLVGLWTEHYRKIDEKDRRRLPLEPIYFFTPEA